MSWPRYRDWYLSEGLERRPTIDEARGKLAAHMPELVPVFDRACSLIGSDEIAHRALSLYRTPPVISGCSVAVALGGIPVLVRNYDFTPDFFEGTVLRSRWTEHHDVIVTSEAWLGALDGVNSAGLAVALTFGGRIAYSPEGFQVPLLLRYVLECRSTTTEASETLSRIPVQAVQNVVILDKTGDYAVVYPAPDREAVTRRSPIATNHQLALEWPERNRWSETAERAECLSALRAKSPDLDRFIGAFHSAPLYRTDYRGGLGTLYTAVISPAEGSVEYRWPGQSTWRQSLADFSEGERYVATA
ncbi:C45 family autoproteolytic acyltransferase/hydolase [Sinorhizobium alkalisoli]|uniref:C45 family autoproteolytic acyltransferase/hydolase n=1 Tax=Sinorhizobium alkalisoli TaxID=1752398 RepID=UPI00124D524D|nr:C45 family peptidase [Sinorhizobium alkalisoli]